MEKQKYEVLFVPHYGTISEWGARRLTAKKGSKDEFTYKEALKVAEKLRKRGDKSIKIRKV